MIGMVRKRCKDQNFTENKLPNCTLRLTYFLSISCCPVNYSTQKKMHFANMGPALTVSDYIFNELL